MGLRSISVALRWWWWCCLFTLDNCQSLYQPESSFLDISVRSISGGVAISDRADNPTLVGNSIMRLKDRFVQYSRKTTPT
ncbi:hypothetical protein F4809DRAFT_188983 [Biscogniauxia mediterranea]|nr:hypothetical protein F4809DRAFT_188983 [Biscogniauxia mediterranea]